MRYYDTATLDGGHLLVMLNNAEWISRKQLLAAVRKERIDRNPFAGQKTQVRGNPDKLHFVPRKEAERAPAATFPGRVICGGIGNSTDAAAAHHRHRLTVTVSPSPSHRHRLTVTDVDLTRGAAPPRRVPARPPGPGNAPGNARATQNPTQRAPARSGGLRY
ncbi:hypothetical protein [Alienimonas sp. DA493]|uniref:hypothetical protein n=1 Tax=Alienimonas sp. DA493 TaxID=3373605 RepID=UPI0037541FFF